VAVTEERAEAILAAVAGLPSQGPPDVFIALVHSTAALVQAEATLAAHAETRDTRSQDAAVRATGAAGLSGLSLYLALAATQRHVKATSDASVPFEEPELDRLIEVTRHVRDSVVHWDDKLGRDPKTFIAFSDHDLVVLAPSGQSGPTTVVAIAWEALTDAARRCRDWATAQVQPPAFD
jgi:hypothetical protein